VVSQSSVLRTVVALAGGLGLVVALALTVAVSWIVAVPVGLLVSVVASRLLVADAVSVVVKSIGAEPLSEGAEPRLESLVESICASNGIPEPELMVLDAPGLDAALLAKGSQLVVIVTRGLLAELDRLELEAVVARELTTDRSLAEGATLRSALATRFGPLVGRISVATGARVRADIAGVATTRYPPALASALEKASRGPRVTTASSHEHLWMVGDGESDGFSLTDRVDVLAEL